VALYSDPEDAFVGLEPVRTVEPNEKLASAYKEAYEKWEDVLNQQLNA
jgi:sugar (pentulose or hexulose) kinase